jgi:hypothetical protein
MVHAGCGGNSCALSFGGSAVAALVNRRGLIRSFNATL